MTRQLLALLTLSTVLAFAQNQKAEVAFVIPEKDLIPEGITYDEKTETFYVGSLSKKKIVAVNKKGVADFVSTGSDDLQSVVGMKVYNGSLWACSNSAEKDPKQQNAVYQYDLTTRKLVKRYVIESDGKKHFLNDLTMTSDGALVISDSNGNCIYRIDPKAGTIVKFLESDELRFANGITTSVDGKKIISCTIRGLLQVDTETKQTSVIPFKNYLSIGIDGLYTYKNSLVGIQNVVFPTTITQYHFSSDAKAIDRADILSVEDPLFYIPTTGVIVKDWFYFLANTQLDQWDDVEGKMKAGAILKDVVIARVKLK